MVSFSSPATGTIGSGLLQKQIAAKIEQAEMMSVAAMIPIIIPIVDFFIPLSFCEEI